MDTGIKRRLQQLSLKVILVAALFLTALFLFAYIAHEAVYEQEDAFDLRVHTFLRAHTTPALIRAADNVTFLGSSSFLFPAYVLLTVFLLIQRKKRTAIDVAIVGLSSFAMMQALKRVFRRQRPGLPLIESISTYSFPSGHSLSSFIFFSILAYLVWRGKMPALWKWLLTILLLLLAVVIGISRIILNVHFATDVIAGFCLGVMWVILSFWIIRKINRNRLLKT